MNIFIPLVGQFTNIGDTLHRSVLIEWLKDQGSLHLYVGSAPDSFISGLYLPKKVILYRNIFKWLLVALLSSRHSCFVYNPGEITGTLKRFAKEALLLPLLCMYRMFGSKVLKVGVDIQKQGVLEDALFRFSNSLTNYTYYRTFDSFHRFGKGEVIPDLGFYKYKSNTNSKKFLAISMRNDRYVKNSEFISALVQYAVANDLEIVVVSQVRMDNESGDYLYRELVGRGCKVSTRFWEQCASHADQELVVNNVYAEALLVVSDRLHVLIAGSNQGAVPICVASYYSFKIQKHFDVIGYEGLVFDSSVMTETDIYTAFASSAAREDEIILKMVIAVDRLESVKYQVFEKLKMDNEK